MTELGQVESRRATHNDQFSLKCPHQLSILIFVMKTLRAKKGSAKLFKATKDKLLTENQIKLFVDFYNIHQTIPGNKIVCNATRKLTTCVGPWKDKKIKEYGGIENLLRNYKRREASPKKKAIVVSISQEQDKVVYDLPVLKYERTVMTNVQLAQETKSACLRPDIYLTNGRHCDGCEYFSLCLSRLKKLPNYAKAA